MLRWCGAFFLAQGRWLAVLGLAILGFALFPLAVLLKRGDLEAADGLLVDALTQPLDRLSRRLERWWRR